MASLFLLLADEPPPSGGGAPPARGHLQIAPSTLSFPSVLIGQADPTQALTLTNSGGTAITVATAISGTNAADYSTDAPASTPLAPGATATVRVGFTPGASGARAAMLTFTHGGDNSPTTVALSGAGLAPAHLVEHPTPIAIPDTRVGANSTTTITLSDTGGVGLTYTASITGPNASDYSVAPASGTIAVGGQQAVVITFTPGIATARTATLTITGTADDLPASFALSGRGRAPLGPGALFGNIGGLPYAGFGFNGDNVGPVWDERIEARILPDQSMVQVDLSACYDQCSFTGGDTNSGLPAGATLTALALLNGAPPAAGQATGQSVGRDQWQDNLAVVGVDVGGRSGGLYYWVGDGALRPWPRLVTPVLSIAVDQTHGALYVGTPSGVYTRSLDPTDTTSPWVAVGSLGVRVIRLQALPDASGATVLFAHAQGTPDKRYDGVYRYPALTAAPSGDFNGWDPALLTMTVMDMLATDAFTYWTLIKADQNKVYKHVTTAAAPTAAPTAYALPAGVRATGLSRVITAGPTPQDSVWATGAGDAQGAYVLLSQGGGVWGPAFQPGNADGSLAAPSGRPLQVNHVVGLGLTLQGQFTSIFACTDNGIFWSATLDGRGWTPLNGQNGLDGISIQSMAAGQQQQLRGTGATSATVNRLFAFNATQFFWSSNSGINWRDITRDKLHAGPYVSQLAQACPGADLPANRVATIGPMAASPIGLAAATHLQCPATYLPADWYWDRRLDGRNDWWYWLVNGNAPLPRQKTDQLTQVQTNATVPPAQAATDLARVMLAWLARNSTPIVTATLASAFSTTDAGLRRLRPTMAVPVQWTKSVLQLDGTGAIRTVQMVNLQGQVLRVKKHEIKRGADPTYADTVTTLVTFLGDPLSPQDLAQGLLDAKKATAVFGSR